MMGRATACPGNATALTPTYLCAPSPVFHLPITAPAHSVHLQASAAARVDSELRKDDPSTELHSTSLEKGLITRSF